MTAVAPVVERVAGSPGIALERAGRGPVVLLLHGIGGGRGNWRRRVAALSRAFTAAAWDMRGHGDSEDYEGPIRLDDVAGDLDRTAGPSGREGRGPRGAVARGAHRAPAPRPAGGGVR